MGRGRKRGGSLIRIQLAFSLICIQQSITISSRLSSLTLSSIHAHVLALQQCCSQLKGLQASTSVFMYVYVASARVKTIRCCKQKGGGKKKRKAKFELQMFC